MFVLDKLLIGGIRFALDKVAMSVEQELNDDTKLREELLAAQMRVELGEMTQEEFTALEDVVLARIREIREARGEAVGAIEFGGGSEDGGEEDGQSWSATDIAGIDATFVADDFHESMNDEQPPLQALPPGEPVADAAPEPAPARRRAAKKKPARARKAGAAAKKKPGGRTRR